MLGLWFQRTTDDGAIQAIPTFICDVCGQPIIKLCEGMISFPEWGKAGELLVPRFCHKGRCDLEPKWLWLSLNEQIKYLSFNHKLGKIHVYRDKRRSPTMTLTRPLF